MRERNRFALWVVNLYRTGRYSSEDIAQYVGADPRAEFFGMVSGYEIKSILRKYNVTIVRGRRPGKEYVN